MNEHMTADGYMTNTHPDAFLDMEKMKKYNFGTWYECPTCKGYGRWNTKLNQYKNQIAGHRHFRVCCGTCGGTGYTMKENPCEHAWEGAGSEAMCLHRYKCKKCGTVTTVDSSG